jgi:signal transduction histidine kinase
MQVMPAIYVLTDNAQEIIAVDSAYDMDDVFYADITKAAFARTATAGKVNVGSFTLKYRRAGPEMLFIDVTSESDFLTGMAYALLFIAVPLLVLIFLLSLFFAHRSIKPIEINYNRQKEFIADASHELKTPLAVISANLEAYNGGQDARFLGYIQEEVGRMAGLTNSLLYLAKMDNPVSSVMLPVDLSRMAEDIWLPLEAVLYEKGITADIDLAQGITVLGDEEQLRRLIGILTDNAVRYADKKITASLERIQNQAVFIIANDGSGIPPEDIEKIWERFYRCDASHQSPQETVPFDGGYGLGLPMAKAITERHKGKIQCQSIPGEMTAFTVRLPVRD